MHASQCVSPYKQSVRPVRKGMGSSLSSSNIVHNFFPYSGAKKVIIVHLLDFSLNLWIKINLLCSDSNRLRFSAVDSKCMGLTVFTHPGLYMSESMVLLTPESCEGVWHRSMTHSQISTTNYSSYMWEKFTLGGVTSFFFFLIFIVLLLVCAYNAWVISPPCPHPPPLPPTPPPPSPPSPRYPAETILPLFLILL
jgi:hypothetical protein